MFLLLAVLVMTRPAGALEHAAGVLCQLACHDEGVVVNTRADLVDLVLCRFRWALRLSSSVAEHVRPPGDPKSRESF